MDRNLISTTREEVHGKSQHDCSLTHMLLNAILNLGETRYWCFLH